MIEITNGIDYVFIKNIIDIYKIELFEDYYFNNNDDKEYKIRVHCFNSNTDEYEYTISFNKYDTAKLEYDKIIKVIRGGSNE